MATSFWPAPIHHYSVPYLPPSVLASPVATSTLDAFDSAQARLLTLRLPRLWPDPFPSLSPLIRTGAQLVWSERGLHCLYRIQGPFRAATSDPRDKAGRMHDSRVELFVCPTARANRYRAFELNSDGRALDFSAQLTSPHSADLDYSYHSAVEGRHTPTGELLAGCAYQHLYLLTVPWRDAGVEWKGGAEERTALVERVNAADMRVAVLRGEAVASEGESGVHYPDTHVWTTAIDSDSPNITFHTTTVFMALQLRLPE